MCGNWLEFAFDSGVFLKNSGFGWKSPSISGVFLKNACFWTGQVAFAFGPNKKFAVS